MLNSGRINLLKASMNLQIPMTRKGSCKCHHEGCNPDAEMCECERFTLLVLLRKEKITRTRNLASPQGYDTTWGPTAPDMVTSAEIVLQDFHKQPQCKENRVSITNM